MNPGVLHRLHSRVTGWLALRVALTALVVLGLVALAAGLCDAALDLPEDLRAIAPWILLTALVAVSAAGFGEWRRLTEERLARELEETDPLLGNRLINAVQLAQRTGQSPVEECLRRETVESGRTVAAQLSAWPVRRRGVQRASILAAGIAGAWILLFVGDPELFRAVWPRFQDVHGDHPPYSRLKIDVAPGGAEVLYGGQLEVRATLGGRPADKLWLVAKTATNETRTMMFLAPDKSFFQTLANLREPTEYFVTDGAARSRRFPIGIRYTPQLTMVEMTAIFPEYTGIPSRSGKLGDEAQSFPEGTRVAFKLASNRPLKSGALELTPVLGGKSSRLELPPETQNTVVTGAFTLSEPVAFTLSVRDVGGLDCAEPRRGRFNILPDRPPRVFVLEPGRDAVATPSIRVPVRVQASDDYAVSRVVWLRGFNRSIERPFKMKLALKGGPQSVESAGAFDLSSLGVRPGDVIEYYFEAADNDPKGPNVAFSRPFRLEIISQEQYEAVLRQAAAQKALFEPYFKLDAWLQRLAERARKLAAPAAPDPAARAEAEALAKELAQYQQQLGKLMQSPAMFDVEQSFRTAMVVQQARLGEAAAKLTQALGGSSPDPEQLKAFSNQLNELTRAEDEAVEQPAREIASVARVVARADMFVTLAQQQAALAQMLRRYSDQTNALSRLEQMEVQELAHQQHRVQEALHGMLEQLPQLLAQVPDDPAYQPLRRDVEQFVQAVAQAGIEADLGSAATALDEPDAVTGSGLARQAAEKMDKLIARCKGLPGPAQECLAHFQPKLSKPGLGNTLQQILAALGANAGEHGRDGYALFNEDVALYGPNVELAGGQADRRGDLGAGAGMRAAQLSGDARDPGLPQPETAGHVRLQSDAKFPLRYRELVGEYFRVIAESTKEGEQ